MKRFRFRLEQVLRIRRLQEDQAKAELLGANRIAQVAAARVDERLHEYRSRAFPEGPQPYAEFERALFMLDAAASAVDAAKDEYRAASDAVAARRADWTAARRKVGALERLEARRRQEHAREVQRDEDRLVDDLAVARFARGAHR